MKKFIYNGSNSGVTLQVPGKGKDAPQQDFEVLLFNGKEVELPEDHELVKTLVLNGNLTEVKPTTKEPEKGDK